MALNRQLGGYLANRGVVGRGKHLDAERRRVRNAAGADTQMVNGDENNPALDVMLLLAETAMARRTDIEIAFAVAAAGKCEDREGR